MIHTNFNDFVKALNEGADSSITYDIIAEYTNNINSKENIEAFFDALINKLDLNFHPDTPFTDYVGTDGTNTFTEQQANALDAIMNLCFNYCDSNDLDIYEIGYPLLAKRLNIGGDYKHVDNPIHVGETEDDDSRLGDDDSSKQYYDRTIESKSEKYDSFYMCGKFVDGSEYHEDFKSEKAMRGELAKIKKRSESAQDLKLNTLKMYGRKANGKEEKITEAVAPVEITLKKVSINNALSEETICFSADVYVNGIKSGFASNRGHGGNTDVHDLGTPESKEAIRRAEEYCKTLPDVPYGSGMEGSFKMDLEYFIDSLVEEEMKKKEGSALERKLAKRYLNYIVYGKKGSDRYREIGWKGHTIDSLKKFPKGIEALKGAIERTKAKLEPGETIWNTNLEGLI